MYLCNFRGYMKKRLLYLGVMAFSFSISIVPHLILKPEITFRENLLGAMMVIYSMVCHIAHVVMAYFLRNKDNFVTVAKARKRYSLYKSLFDDDHPLASTKEYKREFYWQFLLLSFPIPFYIPYILYLNGHPGQPIIPALLFYALPQFVFFIHFLCTEIPQGLKIIREKEQKAQKELREQQEREEMGKFR